MPICPDCKEEYPQGRGQYFKHRWEKHPDDMKKVANKGRETQASKKKADDADADGSQGETGTGQPEKGTKTDQQGSTQTVAAITTPKPGAVVFHFLKDEVALDPSDLLEAYALYKDIKVHCGLKDGFSAAIKDAMGTMWSILVAKPRVEHEEHVSVKVHTG